MICGSYNPDAAVTTSVWALPLSLATTRGITIVFSSSAYLDVSVQQVRLPLWDVRPSTGRVAPFGNLGINAYLQLHPAYRSLSRPSSPLGALASPVRPWLLYVYHKRHHVIMLACSSFSCSIIVFQLSSSRVFFFHYVNEPYAFRLVENKGVEPLTPSLQS